MQLFYNNAIDQNTNQFSFSKEESRHISKVLRKKEGDVLQITNGNGWLFQAQIINNDLNNCLAEVTSKTFQTKKTYNLHLAVAPTKMNDRYEWFLEKATEIGVDTITPIICERSERKQIKHDRFEKMLITAMKQSLQCYLPKLNPATAFNEFITKEFTDQKFIAHCEDINRKSLKQQLRPKQNITILIGPEGDFTVKEIENAVKSNFIPVTLGNTRLRTETAAIAACHSVAFIND